MNPENELTVPKWPFFLADGIFVVAAGVALWFAADPIPPGTVVAAVLFLLLGAICSVVPYLLEFYWSWQHFQTSRDEQLETQRQTLARTGAEIAQLVRRWEELDPKAPPEEIAGSGAADKTASLLGHVQAELAGHDEKLASRIESLLRNDQETRKEERDQFAQALARLDALHERLEKLAASDGGSKKRRSPDKPDHPPAAASSPPPAATADFPSPTASSVAKSDSDPTALSEESPPETVPAQTEATDLEERVEEAPPAAGNAKPKKAAKPRVSEETGVSLFPTTTLVATAFIGAGNKMFLRGEGPGLSWEEGVPMQFVEIGKWSWTTTEATGPIRLQGFKNDEEPDQTGVLTLEPGQRLDIRPVFGE